MEELVAESFTLGRTGDEAGDIDELDDGRNDRFRVDDRSDLGEAFIRYDGDAEVRFDRAERIVLRLDLAAGERVEERRLADVGETDDAAADTHENLSGGDRKVRATRPPPRVCRTRNGLTSRV